MQSLQKIMLKEGLNTILEDLTEREARVIKLRFGIDDGKARTLEEVGNLFDVTQNEFVKLNQKR